MSKINIPFSVVEQAYSNQEMRAKDAVLLESLQRIANSLESLRIFLVQSQQFGILVLPKKTNL